MSAVLGAEASTTTLLRAATRCLVALFTIAPMLERAELPSLAALVDLATGATATGARLLPLLRATTGEALQATLCIAVADILPLTYKHPKTKGAATVFRSPVLAAQSCSARASGCFTVLVGHLVQLASAFLRAHALPC